MSRLRVWSCKDGHRIAVKDMETSHIKNTKSMLVKHAENVALISLDGDGYETIVRDAPIYLWLHDFDTELARRGES